MIELNEDNLKQLINDNDKVIVQFGASWCGNCRLIKPKFKKAAAENESISFVYVDAEKYPESRSVAKVDNLPTFAAFKGGELKLQKAGNKAEIIQELVNEITGN